MPRPLPTTGAAGLSRRAFLRRAAALTAATWGASLWAPGVATARARTLALAASPEGTTLTSALGPTGDGVYVRLTETPGWPTVVRELGATAAPARTDVRRSLATVVHLTDVHVIDAQSPARVEFLDRDADPPQDPIPFESAWRPQETLTTHVADAMHQRLRSIGVGPVVGRPFDCAVSTGDNIDNQQANELDWFLRLLDGGTDVTPNSGDPDRYEGVQDTDALSFDPSYWHPDEVGSLLGNDRYKSTFGYPTLPGLLEAAIAPHASVGVGVPWYSCYGNHDGLVQGNAPANPALEAIATGPLKVTSRPAGVSSGALVDGLTTQDPAALAALLAAPARQVTADPERRFIGVEDWVRAHLDSPASPGPVGHGYSEDALDSGRLYYTFAIAQGVLGICLDSVTRGGYAEGAIGAAQLAWLEERLAEVHSTYLDAGGTAVTTGNDDQLVLLFSHHNLLTLSNPLPDPTMPTDQRVMADGVLEVLHRYPNVVAWVNGHSHVNRVTPYPDPAGRTGGFWEISTASHVDFPQQSRIVEVVDNADGTLSLFGTLVDHAGPPRAELAADVLSLASISRELGLNDPQGGPDAGLGEPGDRNVELLLPAPFALGDTGAAVDGGGTTSDTDPEPDPILDGDPLAATGGGAAVLGGLALGAAAALGAGGRAADDRGDTDEPSDGGPP